MPLCTSHNRVCHGLMPTVVLSRTCKVGRSPTALPRCSSATEKIEDTRHGRRCPMLPHVVLSCLICLVSSYVVSGCRMSLSCVALCFCLNVVLRCLILLCVAVFVCRDAAAAVDDIDHLRLTCSRSGRPIKVCADRSSEPPPPASQCLIRVLSLMLYVLLVVVAIPASGGAFFRRKKSFLPLCFGC